MAWGGIQRPLFGVLWCVLVVTAIAQDQEDFTTDFSGQDKSVPSKRYYDQEAVYYSSYKHITNTRESRLLQQVTILSDGSVTYLAPRGFDAVAARLVSKVNREKLLTEWQEEDFEYALILQDILNKSEQGKRSTKYTMLAWDDENQEYFTRGERLMFAEIYADLLIQIGFRVWFIDIGHGDMRSSDVTMHIVW